MQFAVFCLGNLEEFVILSGVHKHKAKNPKNLRYALILWILRYAQYDSK